MLAVSRLWGRAVMHYPYYQINGTLSNRDIDSKGEFYLNMDEKLIRIDVNMTPGKDNFNIVIKRTYRYNS